MRRHRKRHDKPIMKVERKSKNIVRNSFRREYAEEVHEEIIYVAVDNEELVGQSFEVMTEEQIPVIMQAVDDTYETIPIVETVELKYETVETSEENLFVQSVQ